MGTQPHGRMEVDGKIATDHGFSMTTAADPLYNPDATKAFYETMTNLSEAVKLNEAAFNMTKASNEQNKQVTAALQQISQMAMSMQQLQ